jgi:alanyl-tRNA synthetase
MFDRIKFLETPRKTEKLFHSDSSMTTASATLLWRQGEFAVFDRTIFYPESGGQEYDTGTISDVRVVDVQDQSGEPIYIKRKDIHVPVVRVNTVVVHKLDRPVDWEIGSTHVMSLNWDRRYKLMKSHSTAHFLYKAVQQVYKNENGEPQLKGCHISEDGARFDFLADLPGELIPSVERLSNHWMSQRNDIEMLPEPESNEIYYWTCGDLVIPCGGTHVKHTQELGPVHVSRSKKGQNLTRVRFQYEKSSQ